MLISLDCDCECYRKHTKAFCNELIIFLIKFSFFFFAEYGQCKVSFFQNLQKLIRYLLTPSVADRPDVYQVINISFVQG